MEEIKFLLFFYIVVLYKYIVAGKQIYQAHPK